MTEFRVATPRYGCCLPCLISKVHSHRHTYFKNYLKQKQEGKKKQKKNRLGFVSLGSFVSQNSVIVLLIMHICIVSYICFYLYTLEMLINFIFKIAWCLFWLLFQHSFICWIYHLLKDLKNPGFESFIINVSNIQGLLCQERLSCSMFTPLKRRTFTHNAFRLPADSGAVVLWSFSRSSSLTTSPVQCTPSLSSSRRSLTRLRRVSALHSGPLRPASTSTLDLSLWWCCWASKHALSCSVFRS